MFERALDPRNVRDALLEAGYSPEEVEQMLRAADPRIKEATQRLLDSARSRITEPFTVHGIAFGGEARSCQECGASSFDDAHEEGCSIKLALGVLGLSPIQNRAQMLALIAAGSRRVHISRGAIRRAIQQVGGMSVGDEGLPACGEGALGPVTSRWGPTSVTRCEQCAAIWESAVVNSDGGFTFEEIVESK